MDLILWRHADAEDGSPDLRRALTRKGEKQAEHMAAWLFGITRRVLAQHRRRAWVRRWVPGLTIDPVDPGRGPAALVSVIVRSSEASTGSPIGCAVIGRRPGAGSADSSRP